MTDTAASDDVVVTRSEERLRADVVRVPVRRAIIRKVVVEEERTVTVTLRREELRIDYEGVDVAEGSLVPAEPFAPLDLVLHEERVVTAVVPVERVHVSVERVAGEQRFSGGVRVERIEVDGEALPADDEQGGGRHRA